MRSDHGLWRSFAASALAVAALSVGAVSPARAQVASPSPNQPAAVPAAAPVPESPGVSASALAAKVTDLTSQAALLDARKAALVQQLAAANEDVETVSAKVGATAHEASLLVARSRRQALLAYVNASPGAATLFVTSSLNAGDVNDAAWSLGVVRVSQRSTLANLEQAKEERALANDQLTLAMEARDRVVDEQRRLDASIKQTAADLDAAKLALQQFVAGLGQTTLQGLTTIAYAAYRNAASIVALEQPLCGLRWELLAAIGKTESNHGMGRLQANGDTVPKILGIPIGGDTDQGQLDSDTVKDHAVGPMQFIPSTWRRWAADGNGDGLANIDNIFDEALAAGRYLCSAAGSLTLITREGVVRAILAYNPNDEYLRVVGGRFEALARDVANGWFSDGSLPPVPVAPIGITPAGAVGPPPPEPASPTMSPTEVHTIAPFSDKALVATSAGDPVPGTCDAASAVLITRAGWLQCRIETVITTAASPTPTVPVGTATATPTVTTTTTTTTETLDPCQVAPFDPTLAACVGDPRQPVRLVRLPGALPPTPVAPAPPHLLIVLAGNDACAPLSSPLGRPGKAAPIRRQAVPDPTTTAAPPVDTTVAPVDTTPAPTPTSATSIAATTTTVPPPTTPTPTTPPTTAPPATTAPPTTAAPTTLPPTTTTTVPLPPAPTGATYRCQSGAFLLGSLDTSQPLWTATVAQSGIANRVVPVTQAWG